MFSTFSRFIIKIFFVRINISNNKYSVFKDGTYWFKSNQKGQATEPGARF
jgi:hypothetical protein